MLNELSLKQKYALTHSDARINIWQGAVRSGKSFSALLRFIEFAMSPIKGDFAIVGKTEDALKRNVINELSRLLGSDLRYFSGKRELYLWNRRVYVIGANDERSEGKIRGGTFSAGLIDEGTLIPESFFKMFLSRLSTEGAKLFVTTNPDSPYHWLKTDFINREKELDLKTFKFVLDDNPSLTSSYKDNLKKEYRGLWYRRFIDGDWVLAEGAIYDFFDNDIHCLDFPPGRANYFVIGVDYGTVNPFAATAIGFSPDTYPNMWIEKEYYWDSKSNLRQKTDSEYADDLKKFIEGMPVKAICIDPSAASFIAECRRIKIPNIIDADNDVLTGIRYFSTLLCEGTIKVCRRCKNLLKEIETYVWDDKAAIRGVEQPRKVNDHVCDSVRYALQYFFANGLKQTSPEELSRRYGEVMGYQQNLPKFFQTPYCH